MKFNRSKMSLLVAFFAVSGMFVFSSISVNGQRKTVRTKRATVTQLPSMPPAVLNNEDTLAMIRRRGHIDVGLSLFTPWTMHDKDGNLMGFEVDVARKLAQDLGVELKLHPVGFIEVLADLNTKRFDIVAAGLYATPGRAVTVNFSNPYAESKIEVIASRSVMKGENDMEDFNKADVTFGIVEGTVYASYREEYFPNSKVQTFADEPALIEALAEGKIGAAIVSSPTPAFVAKHSDKKIFRPFKTALGNLGESFAIRKGDVDFLNYLNTWIRYYEQNGWLKKERGYWFEDTAWADKL